jgi:ProP effector
MKNKPMSYFQFLAMRTRLGELFPAAFPPKGHPRPALALGIHEQLIASTGMTLTQTRRFLRLWTNRTRYLKAVVKGGERVNLDGQPAGAISDEHRRDAARRLGRREQMKAALIAERKVMEKAA